MIDHREANACGRKRSVRVQDRAWRRSERGLLFIALLSIPALACPSGDDANAGDSEPLEVTPTRVPPRPELEPVPPPSEPDDSPAPATDPPAEGSAGSGDAEAAPTSPTDSIGTDDISFEADVWPIFNANCGPCHESQRQGGHNVGSDDIEISFEAAVGFESLILKDLLSGSMPPGCAGGAREDACVSEAEVDVVRAWFAAGSPR